MNSKKLLRQQRNKLRKQQENQFKSRGGRPTGVHVDKTTYNRTKIKYVNLYYCDGDICLFCGNSMMEHTVIADEVKCPDCDLEQMEWEE